MMPHDTHKLRPKSTPPEADSARSDEEKTSGVKTWQLLTLGAGGMTCLLALLPAVGHDQTWCLYVAGRMLHGVRLYGPELLESNPPLVMWMMLLPAAAARLLHLPVATLFKVAVVALAAASALACHGILRRMEPRISRTAMWGYGFAFMAITGAMPARDFGQREHLLVLLCLPYVLAAALDVAALGAQQSEVRLPVSVRVAIGIAAGLGFSLKPHHLLVPLAVEGLVAWQRSADEGLERRSGIGRVRGLLRPEPLAILATCLAYLGAIRWLTPEYISTIVPILRDTYWAVGGLTMRRLVVEAVELHVLAAVAIGLWVWLKLMRGRGRCSPLVEVLLAAGAASTVAYYVQGTGWYYQQIPGLSFFSFAFCVEVSELATLAGAGRGMRMPAWAPKLAGGLAALAIVLTAYFSGYTLTRPLNFPSGLSNVPDPNFFAGLAPGTPVAILTTVVDDSVPPVATYRLLWAQRQNNLWTLPAILRNESPGPGDPRRQIQPERLAQLDAMQHAWMVEDLARWKPPLVLVARCQDPAVHCQVLEDRHDDLLAWFERDPAFRAEFAAYRYLRSAGDYDAYVLR